MANSHHELQTMLHDLKLGAMATACSQVALKAAKEGLSQEAFLYELARLECEERTQRRAQRYLQQSKLPRENTFENFHIRTAPGSGTGTGDDLYFSYVGVLL